MIINNCDIKEIELNNWCEILLKMTKEIVENPTKANKWIFDKLTHDEWMLESFPKHLASVNAYKDFYDLTGLDIRNYDWFSTVKTNSGDKIKVHKIFMDEHLTTAYDFKNTLKHYYIKGELSLELIKDLIFKQRLCWITKQENKRLTDNGYYKHRENPLKAYTDCGIEIYNKENEDLGDIMLPNFVYGSFKSGNINIEKRVEFLKELKKYFEENAFNNLKFNLSTSETKMYAYIYNSRGLMVNVRIKDGVLNDICVFLSGDNAKYIFDKLLDSKNTIEEELGYNLVWDRNNNKKATRVGRFGLFSTSPNQYGLSDENENILEEMVKPYNFDLDVKKVAQELVNLYKVFVPRVNDILKNKQN